MTASTTESNSTGPKSLEGKAIASRNSTSHGLFARDVVLTHLGEDPEGYNALLKELSNQIKPHNLLEQHYVEVIAAASWRLRRLQRWQANIYDMTKLSNLERLDMLDRVMRHETMLGRQIDKAVRALARDAGLLFEVRARAQALNELKQTEAACHADLEIEKQVVLRSRELLPSLPVSDEFDRQLLDQIVPEPQEENEKCENELPAEPKVLLPIDTVTEDGWPIYLEQKDREYIRKNVAENKMFFAQAKLNDCKKSYLGAYNAQNFTTDRILAELDLSIKDEESATASATASRVYHGFSR